MKDLSLSFYRLLLIITAAFPGLSQSVSATTTGRMFSEPTLSNVIYLSICRDAEGFLWIATTSGLMKFDGNNYITYTHDENDPASLSDSRLLSVMADSKGRIWAATANGLNLYQPDSDSFKRIDIPSMNYAGYIIDITEQNNGTVTFLASGRGMYVVDESNGEPTAVKYQININDEGNQTCVIQVPDGRMYVGTQQGTVHIISPNGNATPIHVTDSYISDIITEQDGNILVCSDNDIFRIHPAAGHKVENILRGTVPGMHINNFSSSPDGKVYFSTTSKGLWHIIPGDTEARPNTSIYLPSIDISNSKLGALHIDREGNMWIGFHYRGFACIPHEKIPFKYHLLADAITGFTGGIDALAVKGDTTLIGFGNRIGLISRAGKKLSEYSIPQEGTITSIVPAGDDRTLLGVANSGIWEMSLKNGRVRQLLDMPGKYWSILICQLPGKEILAGFHGIGLMRFNPVTKEQKWYEYNPDGGRLNNPFFTSMKLTPDSTGVWLGLYGGISYYDIARDELQILDQSPFISGATYALAPLSGGEVLAGTSHGLIRYNRQGEMLHKYTTVDGLTDNDIRTIIIDRNNGCWIGTKRGLNHMPEHGDNISVYYGGYGLYEKSFDYGDIAPDNNIVMGSNLGITFFNPDSLPELGFAKNVKAALITLNGENINHNTTIDGTTVIDDDDGILTLTLPYKDNALTLHMSTLDFRDAANVRYMWRMTGVSDEWTSNAPGDNVIYLPHLDHGKYRLSIKATDNNACSDETVIIIKIKTPWYMSGIAKTIYAIILITIFTLTWIVIDKKRREKANDAKIKFFIDVSHDIRSPISLILTPLESLMKEPFEPEIKEKLRTMYRNGQRILSLANQLLDLRKIEKGGMRLLCRPTNLQFFIGELVDMFKEQAADKKIDLNFEYNGGVPDNAWIDRDNFDKILANVLSNAIKYTPDGGKIDVTLQGVDNDLLGRCAEISVTDTGIGLGNKTEDQIFTRFYRARENHASGIAGIGIGLDLCRQLTQLHHGIITARNRNDGVRGSVFTILIPMDEQAYAASELQQKNDGRPLPPPNKYHAVKDLSTDDKQLRQKRKRIAMSRRILVVDDDAEMRNYMSRHFESAGYKIATADNGTEALKIVNNGDVDLVVCDVKMPVMDGLTFLRLMKSNVNTHHIPVIMLSSKNDISDRIEGYDRGADGYLGKPFNIEELETLADNLINTRLKLKGKFSGAQDTDDRITPPELKGNDEALMEKIMQCINKHIDNPDLNVEMLGQNVGISRVQLHRKMKDLIGMTPSDFIRNIRLQRACKLLQKPDVEITQVAYAVGFSTQPHFSTAFKRYVGLSPSEYRAKCLSGNVPPIANNNDSPR